MKRRPFMDDVFITEPVAAPSDHDAVLRIWAEHPVVMNDLRRLLRGTCVFVNTLDWLMCPGELAGDAMYSDAGRIYLERREDGWHWVGYLFDEETGLNPDALRRGPLSESPLFTEEREKPIAFRDEGDLEEDDSTAPVRPVKRVPRIEPATPERLADKRSSAGWCGHTSATCGTATTIGECIAEGTALLDLPQAPDGSEVAITFPFVLAPESSLRDRPVVARRAESPLFPEMARIPACASPW